jgi:hypothetical protein
MAGIRDNTAMKIISVKNVTRKDVPIYYRRDFTGTAVLDVLSRTVEMGIDFSIETKPTGNKKISVIPLAQVDYPLLPLTRELKLFINNLDADGGLPG